MTGHEHERHDQQRNDALRARLAGLDPTRPGGLAYAADPTPDQVEELIMVTTQQPTTTEDRRGRIDRARRRRTVRTRWLATAAALVLVGVGTTGVLVARDAHRTTSPPRTVALTVSGGDGPVSSSCVQFDVQLLRDMPVAFAGTVTTATAQQVTLSVDRWYHGTAEQRRSSVVTVSLPGATTSVALDGVEFTQGEQYLVAATNSTVNGCGFSGPADPPLKAAYEQAFGS